MLFFISIISLKDLLVSVRMKNARKMKGFESEIWGIFWSLIHVIFKEFSQSAIPNFNTKPTKD